MSRVANAVTAGVLLAVLTGCGTVVPRQGEQPAADAKHVKCEHQLQDKCWELRVLNVKSNPNSAGQAGLDKPYTSEVERKRRVQGLAPEMWKGFVEGKEQASQPRSFLIAIFGGNPVSVANMASYRVNGANNTFRHSVTKVKVEDVTGKVDLKMSDAAKAKYGQPTGVYRIRTEGDVSIGASLQFPWSVVTEKTNILICSEDKLTVYPSAETNQGLWWTSDYLVWLRDTRKSKRGLSVFLSKDK